MPMKRDFVSLNLLCLGIGLTKMKGYAGLVLLGLLLSTNQRMKSCSRTFVVATGCDLDDLGVGLLAPVGS
jgi:hypothetical protein